MQTLPHRQKRTFKKRSCTGAPGCLLLLLWASPNKQSHLATSCCFRPSPASHMCSFKHTAYCLATQPHSTTGSFFIKSQLKFNERKKKCEIWKWQKKKVIERSKLAALGSNKDFPELWDQNSRKAPWPRPSAPLKNENDTVVFSMTSPDKTWPINPWKRPWTRDSIAMR